MPTSLPRHQITETPELAKALDLAARQWPGESRARLLVRLVFAGEASLLDQDALQRHEQVVLALAGKYAGDYPPGYLAELREDWPE